MIGHLVQYLVVRYYIWLSGNISSRLIPYMVVWYHRWLSGTIYGCQVPYLVNTATTLWHYIAWQLRLESSDLISILSVVVHWLLIKRYRTSDWEQNWPSLYLGEAVQVWQIHVMFEYCPNLKNSHSQKNRYNTKYLNHLGTTYEEGLNAELVQRWLTVEQDDITIHKMALYNVTKL